MLESTAAETVQNAGYKTSSIVAIPEGTSHDIFRLQVLDLELIARFEKPSTTPKKDFHFNGPVSLRREKNLIDLVRDQAHLPAPRVYGLREDSDPPFLLVEALPGMHWNTYLERNGHTSEAYFRSLQFLGRDIGQLHQVTFDSYGDVLAADTVSPVGIRNFGDRLDLIMRLKLEREQQKGSLDTHEFNLVHDYLNDKLKGFKGNHGQSVQTPVLVSADLHPTNILVSEQGKPTGYFDLEACQAASPALEIEGLRWSFLNYYDDVKDPAEQVFLTGYEESGNAYNPNDPINRATEHILGIGHLLAAVSGYHGAKDGLRDNWSGKFKKIMMSSMESGDVDYSAINSVLRSKTGQPQHLNK